VPPAPARPPSVPHQHRPREASASGRRLHRRTEAASAEEVSAAARWLPLGRLVVVRSSLAPQRTAYRVMRMPLAISNADCGLFEGEGVSTSRVSPPAPLTSLVLQRRCVRRRCAGCGPHEWRRVLHGRRRGGRRRRTRQETGRGAQGEAPDRRRQVVVKHADPEPCWALGLCCPVFEPDL
jgi:hypothetical protein